MADEQQFRNFDEDSYYSTTTTDDSGVDGSECSQYVEGAAALPPQPAINQDERCQEWLLQQQQQHLYPGCDGFGRGQAQRPGSQEMDFDDDGGDDGDNLDGAGAGPGAAAFVEEVTSRSSFRAQQPSSETPRAPVFVDDINTRGPLPGQYQGSAEYVNRECVPFVGPNARVESSWEDRHRNSSQQHQPYIQHHQDLPRPEHCEDRRTGLLEKCHMDIYISFETQETNRRLDNRTQQVLTYDDSVDAVSNRGLYATAAEPARNTSLPSGDVDLLPAEGQPDCYDDEERATREFSGWGPANRDDLSVGNASMCTCCASVPPIKEYMPVGGGGVEPCRPPHLRSDHQESIVGDSDDQYGVKRQAMAAGKSRKKCSCGQCGEDGPVPPSIHSRPTLPDGTHLSQWRESTEGSHGVSLVSERSVATEPPCRHGQRSVDVESGCGQEQRSGTEPPGERSPTDKPLRDRNSISPVRDNDSVQSHASDQPKHRRNIPTANGTAQKVAKITPQPSCHRSNGVVGDLKTVKSPELSQHTCHKREQKERKRNFGFKGIINLFSKKSNPSKENASKIKLKPVSRKKNGQKSATSHGSTRPSRLDNCRFCDHRGNCSEDTTSVSTQVTQISHDGENVTVSDTRSTDGNRHPLEDISQRDDVFITYAFQQTLEAKFLADILRKINYRVTLDLTKRNYHRADFREICRDRAGWRRRTYDKSTYVIILCSPAYLEECQIDEDDLENETCLNTRWFYEEMLRDYQMKREKFITVLAPRCNQSCAPSFLGTMAYDWPDNQDDEDRLLRRLTGESAAPKLGPVLPMLEIRYCSDPINRIRGSSDSLRPFYGDIQTYHY